MLDADVDGYRDVCVLGSSLATNLFPFGSALGERSDVPCGYSLTCRSRSELATTLTEESAMAAAAMIGDSKMPNAG